MMQSQQQVQHAEIGQEVWAVGQAHPASSDDEQEEAEEQEDEQLNLRMFGIHQALPIPEGEPDWEAGPPDTAEEYLRRVRAEAAACPRVVRVEFDAEAHAAKQRTRAAAQCVAESSEASSSTQLHHKAITKQPDTDADAPRVAAYVSRLVAAGTLQEGPAWAKPSYQWVRQLVCDFRSMRQWLTLATQQHAAELSKVKLPPVHDQHAWTQIIGGHLPSRPAHENGYQPVMQLSVVPPSSASDATSAHRPAAHASTLQPCAQSCEQSVSAAVAAQSAGSDSAGQQASVAEGVQQEVVRQGGTGDEQGELPGMDEVSGPVLSTVLCIDQVSVSALIQRLVSQVQDSAQLSELDAQWLFALGAVLEKPAHSDVVAAFRSLTRRLAQLRCGLVDASDAQLPRINTLAVVAGAYFGQDESLVQWVSDLELP